MRTPRALLLSRALLLLAGVVIALPASAAAQQASQPSSPAAGAIATGQYHSCAALVEGSVRCWGYGGDGALGYGDTNSVGDDETPASAGPVNLGLGRTAKTISAGSVHTCALLDDGSLRCWGYGGDGRLGYGNTDSVGASQTPASVGPVDLGPGRTAVAISAGSYHTCAILDDGSVRCWGFGAYGQLGYGNRDSLGATPATTPGKVGPVDLGGHRAVAISAGGRHTCAILDDGSVRCWGLAFNGQLGYGNSNDVGATPDTPPGKAGPVDLGPRRTAKAISAGFDHTCAVLDDGSVRCWGRGFNGQLGYGNTEDVGVSQTPGSVAPVYLGPGRTAVAISAGMDHTCATLADGSVRCWGYGANGRLGYGDQNNIGDIQPPGSVGPVDVGSGRTVKAIGAGLAHSCALLDNDTVRCWGYGANGRLGYCNANTVGDTPATIPGMVGPVNLEPGDGGAGCASSGAAPGGGSSPSGGPPSSGPVSGPGATPTRPRRPISRVAADAARARDLRSCLARVASHAKRPRSLARDGSVAQRARIRRQLRRHATSGRRRCLHLYGRTPGGVTGVRARALSETRIELDFDAPGTDANHPPPARSYLVKQSLRPIRGDRDFARAQALCKGSCRFAVSSVGDRVSLTVTGLRPHTTYYYALAARDNVSARPGPRSRTVKARTG